MDDTVTSRPLDFGPPPVSVSVVIPARNEAANLPIVLAAIPLEYEVVVVDGHSVDATMEVARRCRPDARIIQQTRRGKGNALVCGFAVATGEVIVTLDADGSADPQEIPLFVGALVAGADFAKGTRYGRGGGSEDITRFRSMGNRALTRLVNVLFGVTFTDLCYGYNAFWGRLVPAMDLPPVDLTSSSDRAWGDGFEIETLLNIRAASGAQVSEVASVERCRIHGVSNLDAGRDGLRVLATVVAERWRLARRRPGSLRRDRPAGRSRRPAVEPIPLVIPAVAPARGGADPFPVPAVPTAQAGGLTTWPAVTDVR